MESGKEKATGHPKANPEYSHNHHRHDSTSSECTTPFPKIQVKTPSQTASQIQRPKPESAPLYKVPTSPFVRHGANVGRRRANAISLMESPARQGHCHEMARIFQEAQETIATQDAVHTPAPFSPRGATLFGSTPRRRLDLQKHRVGYQIPARTDAPVTYPKLPRLRSDRPFSTTVFEESEPPLDVPQIKRESILATKKIVYKPLPPLPVEGDEISQQSPSKQNSNVETWLREISEDGNESELPDLAATLRLPSPSLSSDKENQDPFQSHNPESKIPVRTRAAACLNALFNKSLAEDDQIGLLAATPTPHELTRWVPRRVPKRLRKRKATEINQGVSKRSPVKFEVGPPQIQSSSSESVGVSTPTVRSLSTESGSCDYHLGERFKPTPSSNDDATPIARRDSGVARADGRIRSDHRTPIEKSIEATETKPLTPEVEKHRKANAPPRRRCPSYFDEDIIMFPRLKNGYIEMEESKVWD